MLSVKITFVMLSINLAFVIGTNQHFICNTVDDVFIHGQANTPNTGRVLHGSPGKRGQKGVKGELGLPGSKGEKGLPGLVDPQNVENVIEQKTEKANRELLRRIETLEELVANLSMTDTISIELKCLEGVVYKKKCYFAILHDVQDIRYQDIKGLCNETGGKPADLLNREHQDVVVNYIQKKRTRGIRLLLGMTYVPSDSTMVWSSGEKVPADVADAMLWWSGYPRNKSDFDKMFLSITTKIGIYNYSSALDGRGVLCQK